MDNLNVLNGAQGMAEMLTQVMAQGATGMQVVRQMLDGVRDATGNGKPVVADVAPVVAAAVTNGGTAEPVAPAEPAPPADEPAEG